MPRPIADQVVVITGASSGVGRACARAFAARGARLGLLARNEEGLAGAAAEARQAGAEVLVLPTDVADADAVERAAAAVEERFGGQVPTAMEDLVTLPGVGRKTANVVRSVGFQLPGLPVDTHVGRLARRLGLTEETDPVRVEQDLNALVPPAERGRLSLRLILHGRRVCQARRPRCEDCILNDFCPSSLVRPQPRNRVERTGKR